MCKFFWDTVYFYIYEGCDLIWNKISFIGKKAHALPVLWQQWKSVFLVKVVKSIEVLP